MTKFSVTANPFDFDIFLAAEYGMNPEYINKHRIERFGTVATFKTKREAEAHATKMRIVTNHARGSRGLPANDCGIFVVPANAP